MTSAQVPGAAGAGGGGAVAAEGAAALDAGAGATGAAAWAGDAVQDAAAGAGAGAAAAARDVGGGAGAGDAVQDAGASGAGAARAGAAGDAGAGAQDAGERVLRGRVYDADGNLLGGGLTVVDGIVTEVHPVGEHPGPAPAEPASAEPGGTELAGAEPGPIILPGLVDVHCHGGGGASFPDDLDPADIARAAGVHRAAGTGCVVGSLVSLTDPFPALAALADACDAGVLGGIHVEGPYVSPDKAGAQNPAAIRPIDLDELARMLDAGRGWIRTVTIAPELDGAEDAAVLLLRAGARPSWGHTNASGERTRAVLAATAAAARDLGIAVGLAADGVARAAGAAGAAAGGEPDDIPAAGVPTVGTVASTSGADTGTAGDTLRGRVVGVAQTVTHLFNAMPPLHHRTPGPVLEFVRSARRGEAVVEVIGDGVHLHLALVRELLEALDGSVALVTDAMAAAGMPDGDYQLGALAVTVRDGAAYLTGTQTLAGGTSTLAGQVARLLAAGVDPAILARAACGTPARALGLPVPAPARVGAAFTGILIAPSR